MILFYIYIYISFPFFFFDVCDEKALCELLEAFFFFLQWPCFCWEFLLLLHSFEFAYTDKNHSSKITADHSASGNDVKVTVTQAELCGYKPSSRIGKVALGGAQSSLSSA